PLANASDADGETLSAVLVSNVSPGTLVLGADGSFDYTPTAGYTGPDSFTCYATDGVQNSSTVTVSIQVTNTAPAANADTYGVHPNTALTAAAGQGFLAQDTDAEGDTLTGTVLSQPSHGTLTSASDGSFTYTPNTGYTGNDSFTYQASDGLATSGTATVTLSVHSSNATPGGVQDEFSVKTGVTLSGVNVLDNDWDDDADPLSAQLVSYTGSG